MENQIDVVIAKRALLNLADRRFKEITECGRGEKYNAACNALLKPLTYRSTEGNICYGLQLPQCFPSMTEPDVLTVLEWYVSEDAIIQPRQALLEVHASYGDFLIPMHPAMRGSYQVLQIMHPQNAQIHMGDLLIVVQPLAQTKGRTPKRKVA